jgi:hypothetical protein
MSRNEIRTDRRKLLAFADRRDVGVAGKTPQGNSINYFMIV